MTQGDGQASMPMTRFPCRASPNLEGRRAFRHGRKDRKLLPPAEGERPLPGAPAAQLYQGLRSLCGTPAPGLSRRQMHRSDSNTRATGPPATHKARNPGILNLKAKITFEKTSPGPRSSQKP